MNLAKCVYRTTVYFTAINLIGKIMYISQLHSKTHFTCFTSETLLLLKHNRNVYGYVGIIALTAAKRALPGAIALIRDHIMMTMLKIIMMLHFIGYTHFLTTRRRVLIIKSITYCPTTDHIMHMLFSHAIIQVSL